MEVKAQAKYIRIAPRKTRLVIDLIRGLDIDLALNQLAFSQKRAAKPIIKLIKSAVANAEHNFELKADNLYIKTIIVNSGPTLKRWKPRAFGRAAPIRKKTSNIALVLAEKVPSKKLVKSKAKKSVPTVKVDQVKEIKKTKPAQAVSPALDQKKEIDQEKVTEPEIFDERRQGKHRHQEHQDKKQLKSKGLLKKMFRRKSGM